MHRYYKMSKENSKGIVVLAYSGGLDTSCILKWLIDNNYEVIAYLANIGQNEDFDSVKVKALKIGAKKVVVDDVQKLFVEAFIWPAISAGLIYEGRYLLGTALARPCISSRLVQIARSENAQFIAHGATGKGNDQVRFELSCSVLAPHIKILAPWRIPEFTNKFQGRQDLLKYAAVNNIPVPVTPKEPWSMDANLMHISYESGVLEDPSSPPPCGIFQMTTDPKSAPDDSSHIHISFRNGLPASVKDLKTGEEITDALELLLFLNKVGGCHGIGRIDIVENRFIGMKSRGIYETPGGKILYDAHLDLETYCMDREVLRVKNYLRDKFADYVYNGLWFSPECNYVQECIKMSQRNVTGWVRLELYKGSANVTARGSSSSTYNKNLVSMDEHGGFDASDADGFIKIHALRLKEASKLLNIPEHH